MSAVPQRLASKLDSETMLAGAVAVAFAVAWTLFVGKEVGWDLFNHQLYLPFSLLSGRFQSDLFGAGPQSYQNPAGYLPFYLLVRSGLPAWSVGVALAVLYAGLITLSLQRINRSVLGDGNANRPWRRVALALAIVAPIFLYVVGTSSMDPLGAGLVLFALAVALESSPRALAIATAGAALGLAVAIKPTSAIFALPVLAVVLSRVCARQWSPGKWLTFLAAAAGIFSVVGGAWAAWLWLRFENPVFPLFNHLFQSPFAPTGITVAIRFLPQTPWDWITRPWEMAQIKPFTMVEGVMPDLRPLLACLSAGAAAGLATRRHGWSLWRRSTTWLRPDVQLVLVMASAYVLWLATSGNARYAIAWFMLSGVVLARALQSCWPSKWVVLGLYTLVGLQLIVLIRDGETRSLASPWDWRPYFPVTIPRQLVDEPFLHLSLGVQSNAAVAAFLHTDGALINVTGQMTLPTHGPLGEQLKQQLAKWRGRTRILFAPPTMPGSPTPAQAIAAENWTLTHRLGLRLEPSGCEVIRLLPPGPGSAIGGPTLLSCPAVEDRRDDRQLDAELKRADQVFALIEAACPRVFGPSPMASDYGPQRVWRHYMNSDARVYVSATKGVILSNFRTTNPANLGSIDQVVENGGRDACAAWKQLAQQ